MQAPPCRASARAPATRLLAARAAGCRPGAAVRRELANGGVSADPDQILSDAEARVKMEQLRDAEEGLETAGWLLGWLEARLEARTGGV